ncbi:MaoC/PaaZ C-terminal domain-containing protein [Micromonospora mirobrigensis]|uniref:MaoC like domain-containing protein n=1 Tax=Micromonospora mirobrigensis TaxID=262898 RepID=A0A1C4VNF1_9ACTN|nr:MaoC/PaaZ C-terminal domain-containing protein [Micromonospora mirobrigensis]SCE85517.1 MaoC like domain-containing protein [Micromonospora mirobrigensis]
MAIRKRRSEDGPAEELSVHDLIDGPTQVISGPGLPRPPAREPDGHDVSVEATHDLSAYATQDLSAHLKTAAPAGPERVALLQLPAAGALYRRALLGALPGLGGRRGDRIPAVELAVHGVAVDRAHLADYDRVCGFRLADRLPGTYPHVLGFPLSLRLMTARDFPVPLTGIVHVANRITVRRPVEAGDTLDFVTYAENLRPHDRGRQLDVVLVASVAGEEVWRGVSTYLSRENRAGGGDRGDRPAAPADTARWPLTPRVGTDYARVSGDHNPIHTSRLGARLFGFPRPIAHGMWSKARCLAALENRLPEAYTVDVAFKLPVPLPSTVAFSAAPVDGGWSFGLHAARDGRPHLAGTVQTEGGAPA